MDMHHYIFGRLCSESTFLCCCSTARLELVRKTHTNSMAATVHVYHSSHNTIFDILAGWSARTSSPDPARTWQETCWIRFTSNLDRLGFWKHWPKAGWMIPAYQLASRVVPFAPKIWKFPSDCDGVWTETIPSDPMKNPVLLWWSLNWNHNLLISSYELACKQYHRNITIII